MPYLTNETSAGATNLVRQRCVFYVSGFDPKGAGHYHSLYRDQAKAHAARTNTTLQIGPRHKLEGGNAAWSVKSGQGGDLVFTHYEFMRWDDVVRNYWEKSTSALWWQVWSASVFNIWHGTLWAMYKLSWPPAVALVVPFALLCAMLFGVPLVSVSVGLITHALSGSGWVAVGLTVSFAFALATWGRKLEARFSMYWMVRSYYFTKLQALGKTPDLEHRLNEQALHLVDRLDGAQDDEVLIVGHSSGAIMAAIIVARALALRPDARVSLLTLGHWLPLLGLLPMAHTFRGELARLANASGLDWLDFSAPPDGCCFALCDPFAACHVSPAGGRRARFKLLNPRFVDMFDPQEYLELKKNRFELHFQYLKAAPKGGDYSYFDITAGSQRLWDRYAHLPGVKDFSGLRPFK